MQIWELFAIAVGLSMDAFAVSVCKGMSVKEVKLSHMAIAGLYFGGFQALMPLLGYLLGEQFRLVFGQQRQRVHRSGGSLDRLWPPMYYRRKYDKRGVE